ncbi:MAG: hypothetical protein K8I27_06540 [Planctomycetes bacterium]|nr:hypothetical protein [Planctomycetota bacterium]
MASSLIKRFSHWLGTWRGACELEDGGEGTLEVSLTPYFDGQVFEVSARIWENSSCEIRGHGIGFWGVNRQGRVENTMWADTLGFCLLEETPDDPDVLAMEGVLSGNLAFSVAFRNEDHVLLISTSVGEGYAAGDKPRTYSRMTRLGMPLPGDDHE